MINFYKRAIIVLIVVASTLILMNKTHSIIKCRLTKKEIFILTIVGWLITEIIWNHITVYYLVQ